MMNCLTGLAEMFVGSWVTNNGFKCKQHPLGGGDAVFDGVRNNGFNPGSGSSLRSVRRWGSEEGAANREGGNGLLLGSPPPEINFLSHTDGSHDAFH